MVSKDKPQLALSKSKYCGLWQCPKMAWLSKYKPEEFTQSDDIATRMENGQEVGTLARGLFGEFKDVTCYYDGRLDLSEMIRKTSEEMEKGTPVICEASFSYEGLYCAVDILKKTDGGWAIYEVKSSTQYDKDVYYADIAYQEYVLKNCGISVVATYLVIVNNEYVFDGNLCVEEFFRIENVTDEIETERCKIEPVIRLAEKILTSDKEPEIDLSVGCNTPYPCGFWDYCTKDIPNPSVFDLYRMNFKKKLKYYYRGIISYEDLMADNSIENEKQLRQIEHFLYDKKDYVDCDQIDAFLATLSYPLYFLDFESMQPVIPRYIGTKPYQQIPFQYSLHYIESEGGELHHKEFLAEAGKDPRRELAERLCADIPRDVCVVAYYKSFECSRIKELAEAFPDLADHLLNIGSNIVDLLDPFQSGWYYNKAMGGSFSIKSVLPALFPNDPELNYKALTDVHNGTEAMTMFAKLESISPEEQAEARKNLLEYCKLDTLAMVRVWEKLRKVGERSK